MAEDEQPELLFFDTFSHDINEVSFFYSANNDSMFK